MTQPELTTALKDIDTTAAKARRAFHRGAEPRVFLGYLLAIQQTAQAAMQGVQDDSEQQVMDYAAGHLTRQAGEPT